MKIFWFLLLFELFPLISISQCNKYEVELNIEVTAHPFTDTLQTILGSACVKAGNHFGYWFGVDWRMSPRHCTMRPIFRTRSGFTGSVDPTKNGVPTAMPISWQIFLRSGLSRTTPPITDSFRKPNNWTVS